MKQFWSILTLTLLIFSVKGHAAVSSLVADTKSGFVIESQNSTTQRPPASLTKLMTLYLLFSAIDNGVLSLSDPLPISQNAANQPKSKLGLIAGETITVQEAIMALIIKSANDAAVVVAESLSPSEAEFATLMTNMAHTLNMTGTTFKNASGLHTPEQVSSARDMAILSMALIEHFPHYYPLFSQKSFSYKGETYQSHNNLLDAYEGSEGLKTGFVSAGGYSIIATAKKGNSRIISVVMGEKNPTKRDLHAMRLLDKGFKKVAIQQQAEQSGRLNGAFNPLNRKAFISRPTSEIYLPAIKHQVANIKTKGLQAIKPVVVAKAHPQNEIEQGDSWSIQVGAFKGREKAHQLAEKAFNLLGKTQNKSIHIAKSETDYFRSQIHGFSNSTEAIQACRQLKNANLQCFTIAPNG